MDFYNKNAVQDKELEKQSNISYSTSLGKNIQDFNVCDTYNTNNILYNKNRNSNRSNEEDYVSEIEEYSNDEVEDSKVKSTSFFSCLCLFIQVGLGIGVLGVPRTLNYISFSWGVFFLTLMAICNWWSLNLLAYVCNKKKIYEYSKLLKSSIGRKYAKLFNLIIIFATFLTIIAFIDTIYKLLGESIYNIFYNKDNNYLTAKIFIENSEYGKFPVKLIVMMLIVAAILFPIALKKQISEMAFFAYLGIGSLIYIYIILIVQCPGFFRNYMNNIYNRNDVSTYPNWNSISRSFTKELKFFPMLSSIIFAYNVHFAIISVYSSLENNTYDRLKKLNLYGNITTYIATLLLGIVGFLTFPGNNPKELIILRENYAQTDYFMTIGKLLICLSVIGEYAVTFNSMRLAFFSIAKNRDIFSNKE